MLSHRLLKKLGQPIFFGCSFCIKAVALPGMLRDPIARSKTLARGFRIVSSGTRPIACSKERRKSFFFIMKAKGCLTIPLLFDKILYARRRGQVAKARVCKTLIMGSNPIVASNF